MNELQDFNLDDLYDKLHLTDDEFDQWLASIGLLHGSMDCICGQPMHFKQRPDGKKFWVCYRAMHRPAKPHKGYKLGTFFESAKLSNKQIFKLSYFWAMSFSIDQAEFETRIAHRIVVSLGVKRD